MRNNLCCLFIVMFVGVFSIQLARAEEGIILYQTGTASLYDFPGDKYSGQHVYACERRLRLSHGAKKWNEMLEYGIAHRTLPCGTKVYACTVSSVKKNSPKCTVAYVIDRGPYGALNKKNDWFVRAKLNPGERWRGIVDLRPTTAQRLSFNGLEKIFLYQYQKE